MRVEFRRTGERRYTVTVHRPILPAFTFGGPGYDALLPHDLQHLIVESELGLHRGVFGFMAAGGHAGATDPRAPGEDRRQAARRRVKAARRDDRRLRQGDRADGPASERATYVCWYEWLRRAREPERRARAATMAAEARHILGAMPDAERQAFSDVFFERVRARLDEVSAQWAGLGVGQSLFVEWTVHGPSPRPRR